MSSQIKSVQDIIEKNKLERNSYFSEGENPMLKRKKEVDSIIENWPPKGFPPAEAFIPPKYKALISRWGDRCKDAEKTFYTPFVCPDSWYYALDDLFSYVKENCSSFTISSVTLEFGGLKICLDGVTDEIKDEIAEFEEVLFDERLVNLT